FVEVADTVAVENRETEAFRDEGSLGRIGASKPDHFESGSLAQRNDAGAGAGIGSFSGHDMSFLFFPEARTGSVPALPRARTTGTGGMTGASGSGRTEGEHGRFAAKQGFLSPRAGRGPAIARSVRSGRNAARNAALKRTAAGSGPQPDR